MRATFKFFILLIAIHWRTIHWQFESGSGFELQMNFEKFTACSPCFVITATSEKAIRGSIYTEFIRVSRDIDAM